MSIGSGSTPHSIEVDDEVWAALKALSIPFVDTVPNDVLRRELLGTTPARTGSGSNSPQPLRRQGSLKKALDNGSLKAGDVLVIHQPRKKVTFTASVTDDGWIRLSEPPHNEFQKPSQAAYAAVGTAMNGWDNWVVEGTGEKIQKYRYQR